MASLFSPDGNLEVDDSNFSPADHNYYAALGWLTKEQRSAADKHEAAQEKARLKAIEADAPVAPQATKAKD